MRMLIALERFHYLYCIFFKLIVTSWTSVSQLASAGSPQEQEQMLPKKKAHLI
jgi:hypothetical protein